jgi:GxxExxY protein
MENQKSINNSLLFPQETYNLRGAIFEVYKELGSGFLESVYQECLRKELILRNIPHISQPDLMVTYKGEPLQLTFKPDFICYDLIIVELKAVKELSEDHRAQIHNYLRTSGFRLGLLVNFSHVPRVEIERIII